MKKFVWLFIGLMIFVGLAGCGQGATGDEANVKEMTATYIGLIDNHTFEVEKDGQPVAVQFDDQFYDELEPLLGGEITFKYEVDENGVNRLVEIVEIRGE